MRPCSTSSLAAGDAEIDGDEQDQRRDDHHPHYARSFSLPAWRSTARNVSKHDGGREQHRRLDEQRRRQRVVEVRQRGQQRQRAESRQQTLRRRKAEQQDEQRSRKPRHADGHERQRKRAGHRRDVRRRAARHACFGDEPQRRAEEHGAHRRVGEARTEKQVAVARAPERPLVAGGLHGKDRHDGEREPDADRRIQSRPACEPRLVELDDDQRGRRQRQPQRPEAGRPQAIRERQRRRDRADHAVDHVRHGDHQQRFERRDDEHRRRDLQATAIEQVEHAEGEQRLPGERQREGELAGERPRCNPKHHGGARTHDEAGHDLRHVGAHEIMQRHADEREQEHGGDPRRRAEHRADVPRPCRRRRARV